VGLLESYAGAATAPARDVAEYANYAPTSAKGAAISVAVLIVSAALFLTVLKRSGFRAMVAVGRS
jgi:hypothetical protein